MTDQDAPRGGRAALGPLTRLDRHTRSPEASYRSACRQVNRTRPAKLSRTAAPASGADLDLWPAWTDTPITRSLVVLDLHGKPIVSAGGGN